MDAEKRKRSSAAQALAHHLKRHAAAYTVLFMGVLLTAAAHDYVASNLRASNARLFKEDSEEMIGRFRARLEVYVSTLLATGGLMTTNPRPTQAELRNYLQHLDVQNRAPRLRYVGFVLFEAPSAPALDSGELSAPASAADKQLVPRHTSVVDLTSAPRQLSLGWLERLEVDSAISQARDLGSPVAASRTVIESCQKPGDAPEVMIYVPVYARPDPGTLEDRRAGFRGIVFGAFCGPEVLLALHTPRTRRTLEVSLLDTQRADSSAIVETEHTAPGSPVVREKVLERSVPVEVGGRTWSVVFRGYPDPEDASQNMLAPLVAFGGIMASILLFAIVVSQVGARDAAEVGEKRFQLLADAGRIFTTELDEDAAVEEVAKLPVPRFADWCAVDLFNGCSSEQFFYPPSTFSHELAEHLRVVLPLTSPRLLTGNAELIADTRAEDPGSSIPTKVLASLGARSVIRVPMVARNETMGLITFVSTHPTRQYAPTELLLAADLARIVGGALDGARQYRMAQEANRLKDEFLSTLSHELRTPLNAILGWAHLLRSAALDEPTRQRAVETIERNARQQAQIVNDLLDVSRIILGQVRLERGPVELASVIHESMESVQLAAEAKRIEIVSICEPSSGYVLGDRSRLVQIVWNLLSNGIKFTPSGGRVDVRLRRSGEAAEIIVADDGQGISSDFLPFLFERFRQADGSSTRRHGGLGLGLAIVRHLVELHGGTVHASSEGPGKGAIFTVRLHAVAAAGVAPVELTKRPERRATTTSGAVLAVAAERKQA